MYYDLNGTARIIESFFMAPFELGDDLFTDGRYHETKSSVKIAKIVAGLAILILALPATAIGKLINFKCREGIPKKTYDAELKKWQPIFFTRQNGTFHSACSDYLVDRLIRAKVDANKIPFDIILAARFRRPCENLFSPDGGLSELKMQLSDRSKEKKVNSGRILFVGYPQTGSSTKQILTTVQIYNAQCSNDPQVQFKAQMVEHVGKPLEEFGYELEKMHYFWSDSKRSIKKLILKLKCY